MNSSHAKSYLPYNIYVYREELCRRRRNIVALNKAKIDITQELIVNCARKLWECDQDDIEAFSRQLAFRDRLLEQQNYLYRLTNVTQAMEVDQNVDLNCDVEMELDVGCSADLDYFGMNNNLQSSKNE